MSDIDTVWERIHSHSGEEFRTITGLPFSYRVEGNYLRITRNGTEINRSLSKSNFAKALDQLPTAGPGALKALQGAAYTWAILNDSRIRP